MSRLEVKNENELIQLLREGEAYKEFTNKYLQAKIEREKKAWMQLVEHRGKYTIEILDHIFDELDFYVGKNRWFGSLLSVPNKNRIFESGIEILGEWIDTLIFSDVDAGKRLTSCLDERKIKGASKGIATLLLYLLDATKFNIWLDATQQGLAALGRFKVGKENDWGQSYAIFNSSVIEFRDRHGFAPQEMDWVLSFFSNHLERATDHFVFDDQHPIKEKQISSGDEILEVFSLEKRSWSRPENIPNLIGRKRVDWSLFEYGIHIPIEFHKDFERANGGIHLDRGQSHNVQLLIAGESYKANLRKGAEIDTLQIRYDANDQLKQLMRKIFKGSFLYFNEERSKKTKGDKKHVKIPDELAQYVDFIQTETPFQYRIETKPSISLTPLVSPNIWWVNQGKTLDTEREEGILWAPIKSAAGRALYHWETMIEIKKGDIVIHYANGAIRYVSKVISEATEMPKPKLLGGSNWDEKGRLIHTKYYQVEPEIKLEKFSKELLNLDINQGPIDKNGNVKEGYLFRLGLEGLRLIQSTQPETNWPEFTKIFNGPAENYWIFQGNPKVFNLFDALRNGDLKTWSVYSHKKEIKKGDKLILWATGPKAGCYALGTIASDVFKGVDSETELKYSANPQQNPETDRCRVEFEIILVDNPILKEEIKDNPLLQNLKVGIQGTNFSATKEEYDELMRLAIERTGMDIPKEKPYLSTFSIEDFTSDTGFDRDLIENWKNRLLRKMHVIIQGPPGTGKTYIAERLARLLISGTKGFWEVIQFHPAYAYEDFIQGVRPKLINGNISWELQQGRFLQFCNRTRKVPSEAPCVLIIDEINRAHLSRVFGELMYLLEYRSKEIPLAGGGELFRIPDNVYIIGTMNTADRSIALVDHALRRRFSFIRLNPNYELLSNHLKSKGLPSDSLVLVLKEINKAIDDPNYELGISYFMKNENLKELLPDIWIGEIEPYLEEFFYDQPEKIEPFRWTSLTKKQLQDWTK